MGLVALGIPFCLFAMVVLLVWIRYHSRQVEAKTRAEIQKHFLDKFGSGKELAEFVESESGRRFIDELVTRQPDHFEQLHGARAGGLILPGFLFALPGLGFLGLTAWVDTDLAIPTVIFLGMGVGFLITAWIKYRMAATGDTPEDEAPTREEPLP